MCGGGGNKKAQAAQAEASARAQEQSLALQREQMAMQQKQMDLQQAQYREQLAISNAPPPPAPEPVAMTARSAIEMPVATAAGSADTGAAATPQSVRTGIGRRKLRTDWAGGLNIPAIGAYR
jgi:hypothetical protein